MVLLLLASRTKLLESRDERKNDSAFGADVVIEALGQWLAERGKAKMVIVGTATRKRMYICFGMSKNRAPFDSSLLLGT